MRLICATLTAISSGHHEGSGRHLPQDPPYYRVGVLTLELPALRSYKNNLEVIAGTFLRRAAQDLGRGDLRSSALTPWRREARWQIFQQVAPCGSCANCMEYAAAMSLRRRIA
ncbi:MAG: hypothetical protein IPI67_17870 [Myxococcales bacterium]|nr:hypothetical protein [Myxococcales bacterium]